MIVLLIKLEWDRHYCRHQKSFTYHANLVYCFISIVYITTRRNFAKVFTFTIKETAILCRHFFDLLLPFHNNKAPNAVFFPDNANNIKRITVI